MGTNEIKQDFLKECMTDPALVSRTPPIDQFCQTYCVVCGYKPCSRSRANQMVFTERVANWRPRLFTAVPRAADDDENYATIRAKSFRSPEEPLEINSRPEPSPVPVPEKPPETPVRFIPIAPTESPVQTPPITPSLVLELGSEVGAPVQTLELPPMTQHVAAVRQPDPVLNNTPFQGGIILPGKPADRKEDQFVQPGGTFTFGDEDEEKK